MNVGPPKNFGSKKYWAIINFGPKFSYQDYGFLYKCCLDNCCKIFLAEQMSPEQMLSE